MQYNNSRDSQAEPAGVVGNLILDRAVPYILFSETPIFYLRNISKLPLEMIELSGSLRILSKHISHYRFAV